MYIGIYQVMVEVLIIKARFCTGYAPSSVSNNYAQRMEIFFALLSFKITLSDQRLCLISANISVLVLIMVIWGKGRESGYNLYHHDVNLYCIARKLLH
jgi:hypothetical protein